MFKYWFLLYTLSIPSIITAQTDVPEDSFALFIINDIRESGQYSDVISMGKYFLSKFDNSEWTSEVLIHMVESYIALGLESAELNNPDEVIRLYDEGKYYSELLYGLDNSHPNDHPHFFTVGRFSFGFIKSFKICAELNPDRSKYYIKIGEDERKLLLSKYQE